MVLLLLAACGARVPVPATDLNHTPNSALLAMMTDETVTSSERIERILKEARPGNVAAVATLRHVLADRSQTAFILEYRASATFGLAPVENPYALPLDRGVERAMAAVALEAISSYRALPELLHALDDRDGLVAAHAARALLKLGCRSGISNLLASLERKAYESEIANRMLIESTGEDFGFDADIGMEAKARAATRWKTYWAKRSQDPTLLKGEGTPYVVGFDAIVDARIRTEVDIVGQFQFLFMEQSRKMLARLGDPALPFITEGLGRAKDKPTWRAGLAQALAGMGTAKSHAMLTELLGDPFPSVRSRSAEALVAVPGDVGRGALLRALKDVDPSVPLAALRAVGSSRREDAIPLLSGLKGPREVVEAAMVARFRVTRDKADRPAVVDLVEGGLSGARALALLALAEASFIELPDSATVDEGVRKAFLAAAAAAFGNC